MQYKDFFDPIEEPGRGDGKEAKRELKRKELEDDTTLDEYVPPSYFLHFFCSTSSQHSSDAPSEKPHSLLRKMLDGNVTVAF